MKKIKTRCMAFLLVAVMAFSVSAAAPATVFANQPGAPVLSISGSQIYWTAVGNPFEFVVIVNLVEEVTLGSYASSYDLSQLNLNPGSHTVVVRANFQVGDGISPVLTYHVSNPVTFVVTAPQQQQLPAPSINLVGGYFLEININWPGVPNVVRDSAYFIIYAGGQEYTRIPIGRPNGADLDLWTLGLGQGSHQIRVAATIPGGYWIGSAQSNTVNFAVPSATRELPTPSIRIYGPEIQIDMPRGDVPTSVFNNIRFRIYVDGQRRQGTVEGDFPTSALNLPAGSGIHRVLVVATVNDPGWRDSRRSNELSINMSNMPQIGNATVTPSTVVVGNNVTVNITGIANTNRLEILTRAGTAAPTVAHTVNNPAATINRQLTLDNVNINAVLVRVYGPNNTRYERVINVTVNPMTAVPPIAGIGPSIDRYIVLENGIGTLLEWQRVANNRFGYRVFRATSETAEGVSITTHPIIANSAFSDRAVVTFDPNASPGGTYWYYIREVTQISPEALGAPGQRVRVTVPAEGPALRPNVNRGFILMVIGNRLMNVNNTQEEVDPGLDTVPIIREGRTLVPIRAIVEHMGGEVAWDQGDRRVELYSHGNSVQMWLDGREARVNGQIHEMDIEPQLIGDRTFIPVRFVAEFLGSYIGWIESERMVIIIFEM